MEKAIILAAGKGTRLLPLTLTTPKSLIEISGKSIVKRIIESLPNSIGEVIVVVGHLKDEIKKHLGDEYEGRRIVYADQEEKKGTFGALLSARHLLNEGERFLVLNGDDLHNKNELEKFVCEGRAFGVQKMVMPNYYSIQITEGLIDGFRPQTDDEKTDGALIATGVYTLDTNIFDHTGIEVYGGEYGLPQTILRQKSDFPIKAIETMGWIPINSFADLERANKLC